MSVSVTKEPVKLSEIKEFLLSVVSDWGALVSGVLSVPSTIVSTYSSSSDAKLVFGVLAFLAFLFAAFRVWRNERLKVNSLENRLLPQLTLSFDSSNDSCKTPVPNLEKQIATAFRLKVESRNSERVTGCSGKLLCINGPFGKIYKHQFIQLTFTHSEQPDTISKTVDFMAPIYLDVVNLWHEDNRIQICAYNNHLPNGPDWPSFFCDKGEYIFEIQVAADKGPPRHCKLKLIRTEHWATTSMKMVD